MSEHPMVQRLIAIHDHMRRDLALLRRADTVPPSLRTYCLRFCEVVHGHHGVEESMLFPALRDQAGGDVRLLAVIDRLEAEHRELLGHLDQVERLFARPPDDPHAAAQALTRLADHLLAHFAYEEESIAAALRPGTP